MSDGCKLNLLGPEKIDRGQWPENAGCKGIQRLIWIKETGLFGAV